MTDIAVVNFFPDVFRTLHELQQTGTLCDLCLRGEDGSVSVHRVILMSFSQTFMQLLSLDLISSSTEIYFQGVTTGQLQHLVHLMYTGRICLSISNVSEKLKLFSDLNVEKAVVVCKKFIDDGKRDYSNVVMGVINAIVDKITDPNKKQKNSVGRPRKHVWTHSENVKRRVGRPKKEVLLNADDNDLKKGKITEDDSKGDNLVEGKRKRNPPHRFIETFNPNSKTGITRCNKNNLIDENNSILEGIGIEENAPSSDKPLCDPDISSCASEDGSVSSKSNSNTEVEKEHSSLAGLTPSKAEQEQSVERAEIQNGMLGNKDTASNTSSPTSGKKSRKKDSEKVEDDAIKKCQKCEKHFKFASLRKKHQKFCVVDKNVIAKDTNGNRYQRKKCTVCKAEFADHESFRAHRKEHVQQRVRKRYHCEFCGTDWKTAAQRASHMFSKHDVPFDGEKFAIFKCDEKDCGFETVEHHRLDKHKLCCHMNIRPYVCEICEKSFKTGGTLRAHTNIHTRTKIFICPEKECGQTFTQKGGMDRHIEEQHLKIKSALCHLCSYSCYQKSVLNKHLYKAHQIPLPKNYKQFKCEICDYVTFRNAHFTDHMNAHRDIRQYQCHVCSKRFTSSKNLNGHMKFHNEEKKIKCPHDGCDYAAVQRTRLNQHIRLIHTHKDYKPFACSMCKYQTGIKGNLDKHLRMVHRVEPEIRRRRIQKLNKNVPVDQGEEVIISCYSVPDNVTTLVISQKDMQTSFTMPGEITTEKSQDEEMKENQSTINNCESLLETADMILTAVKQQNSAVEVNEQVTE